VEHNRYDENGNYHEHGRYDRSGNYVYTSSERKLALLIGLTLLGLGHLLEPLLDKLPHSGVIEGILGGATFVAL
jgi:hypothetical protein